MAYYSAAAVILWALAVLGVQRHLIYPRFLMGGAGHVANDEPGVFWLDTSAGPVEGRLLLGHGVSAQRPGPAVIFAHGNAERIGDWSILSDAYRQLGVTVLLGEYRGYGRSAGKPSQRAITEDFVRFYDHLVSLPEVDPERVVFHGRSLGGGVVCALAAQRPPAAMILQSVFTSVTAVARGYLVPRVLVLDPYDNLKVVERLEGPLLVIHGRNDEIIPYRHGQALHAAAGDGTMVTYECGHNDCPPNWQVFWRDIHQFLVEQEIILGQ